jgi:hypothetical protein
MISNAQRLGPFHAYVTRIEDSSIVSPYFGKRVAFVAQEPVHVPNKPQVLLVPTRLADGAPPFFDGFQDLALDSCGSNGRALGESPDEFIEKLFGADLEMKGVSTVLDTDVQQIEGEDGNVCVAMVDVPDNCDGSFSRGATLLAVDEVGNLKVQCQIGLVILGAAGGGYEALQL